MRISDRTIQMLIYVATHGIITHQIAKTRFTPTASQNTVVTWLRRNRERSLLHSRRLYGNRRCNVITQNGITQLKKKGVDVGKKAIATNRLNPALKRELYAINLFCNEEERSKRVLHRPHLEPELYPRIKTSDHDTLRRKRFVRDGDAIYFFRVDSGTQNYLNESVIPKVYQLLGKFPEFVSLMGDGNFRLAISTGTEARADELLERLQENPPPMSSEVIVYPELVHFLPQLPQPIV